MYHTVYTLECIDSIVHTRAIHITTEWKTIGTSQELSRNKKYIFIFSINVQTYV